MMISKINIIINNLQMKHTIMMIFNKKNFRKIKINIKKRIKIKTIKIIIRTKKNNKIKIIKIKIKKISKMKYIKK